MPLVATPLIPEHQWPYQETPTAEFNVADKRGQASSTRTLAPLQGKRLALVPVTSLTTSCH